MSRYSREIIEETKMIWQPYSEARLTTEDAVEIIDNTVALLELLRELNDRYAEA